jgi:hypothetical protein
MTEKRADAEIAHWVDCEVHDRGDRGKTFHERLLLDGHIVERQFMQLLGELGSNGGKSWDDAPARVHKPIL